MTKNLCIEVVVRELNAVRARHHVEPAAEGVVRIRWAVANRAQQTTTIVTTPPNPSTPQQARDEVRRQLKRIGVLAEGGRSNVRGWHSDDPPLAPSAPRTPVQVAIDAIADRIARLSLFGRDPTRFASERSEIVAALRRLARG